MEAGQLTKKISIKAKTFTTNNTGERTESWAEIRNCWANITLKSNNEIFSNDQTTHLYTYVMTTRYFVNPLFNETCQIVFNNETYSIETIDTQQMWDEIRIYTRKIV